MKLLTGNTYPHKNTIKSKGGTWDNEKKGWLVPDHHYDELAKLCQSSKPFIRRKYECPDCCEMVYSGSSCWETGLKH